MMLGHGTTPVKLAVVILIAVSCADPIAPPRGHLDAADAERLHHAFFPDSSALFQPPAQIWTEVIPDTMTLMVNGVPTEFNGILVESRVTDDFEGVIQIRQMYLWTNYNPEHDGFEQLILTEAPSIAAGYTSSTSGRQVADYGNRRGSSGSGSHFVTYDWVAWSNQVACAPLDSIVCSKRIGKAGVTLSIEGLVLDEQNNLGGYIVPTTSFYLPVAQIYYGEFADSVMVFERVSG